MSPSGAAGAGSGVAGVATSDPRATDVAVSVLETGGNAVDAAVAAAFVLFVVEPQSAGVAGDAFVILAERTGPPDDRSARARPGDRALSAGRTTTPVAYDGSGASPAALTAARLAADGLAGVPPRGGRSVSVPGAVALLETLLVAHGRTTLRHAVAPAIGCARDGFAVRPSLAKATAKAVDGIGGDPVLGPLYVPGGVPVAEGDVVRNPALAACLEALGTEGATALYRGALADALIETVQADGGYLDADDLAAHTTDAAAIEHVEFRGRRVWELPLPTQGPAVLHALAALEASGAVDGVVDWPAVLDATRAGMTTAGFDPVAMGARPSPAKGDTTYLAVVDQGGLAVSLITSVFGDFGSHLGVPALGGPVHNRATMFRMLHRDPTPGKPPHTTIPGMVTDDSGAPLVCLGVAGGIMQPQTQVQLLVRMLCEGMDAQAAVDAPRFKICFGGALALEAGHPLEALHPDAPVRDPGPEGFGNAQVVGWCDGELATGADSRRGGTARLLRP
jgi:gamma-glutamyltranspeptidase/glutathione hydrolase